MALSNIGSSDLPILLLQAAAPPNLNQTHAVEDALTKCALCRVPTSNRCSTCKTRYCSATCIDDHWPVHKWQCCRPPTVEVANRSLLVPEVAVRAQDSQQSSLLNPELRTLTPENVRESTSSPKSTEDCSQLSNQLLTQLDDLCEGDTFQFQPNLFDNSQPEFEAVLTDRLTLESIGTSLQEYCEILHESGSCLISSDIFVSQFLIVYDEVDRRRGHFKRAFVTKKKGGIAEVILIDYSELRSYPLSSSNTFFDVQKPLDKFQSCGIYFEPVETDFNHLLLSNGDNHVAKVNRKIVGNNNRTEYCEVTVFDGQKRPLADFRVFPWYKLDRTSTTLLLPDIKFCESDFPKLQIPRIFLRTNPDLLPESGLAHSDSSPTQIKLSSSIRRNSESKEPDLAKKVKLSDMPPLRINVGDVLSVVGVDDFSNRLIVTKPHLEKDEDLIADVLNCLKKETKTPLGYGPEKGQVVSCKWANEDLGDGINYRAVITSIGTKTQKVKVRFLDYGNCSIELFDSLSPLPSILTDPQFPCLTEIVHLADIPEKSLKDDKKGLNRLTNYLVDLGDVILGLVVAKIEEVDGVKFYTLATPEGHSVNKGMKKAFLAGSPASESQVNKPKDAETEAEMAATIAGLKDAIASIEKQT